MSISKQTTLWCDEPGCDEWYAADTGAVREARQEAWPYGWRRVSGKDLCGYHAPKSKQAAE